VESKWAVTSQKKKPEPAEQYILLNEYKIPIVAPLIILGHPATPEENYW
jgi:hypothetical protein